MLGTVDDPVEEALLSAVLADRTLQATTERIKRPTACMTLPLHAGIEARRTDDVFSALPYAISARDMHGNTSVSIQMDAAMLRCTRLQRMLQDKQGGARMCSAHVKLKMLPTPCFNSGATIVVANLMQ